MWSSHSISFFLKWVTNFPSTVYWPYWLVFFLLIGNLRFYQIVLRIVPWLSYYIHLLHQLSYFASKPKLLNYSLYKVLISNKACPPSYFLLSGSEVRPLHLYVNFRINFRNSTKTKKLGFLLDLHRISGLFGGRITTFTKPSLHKCYASRCFFNVLL